MDDNGISWSYGKTWGIMNFELGTSCKLAPAEVRRRTVRFRRYFG